MDTLVRTEIYEGVGYLTISNGDVYRVFLRGEPYPLQEKLMPFQLRELEALRLKYTPRADERQ